MNEMPGWDRRAHLQRQQPEEPWWSRNIMKIIVAGCVVIGCVFIAAAYIILHFVAKVW